MVEPDLFAAAAWWGTPSVESVEINIGYLAEAVGEFDIAEELWLSALARLERHGANRDSMETFYANIGASELWQGRHEEAELHLRMAIEAAARLGGDPATPASSLLDLCRLELLRDRPDSAAALLEEAMPFVRDCGLVEFDFAADLLRAQILLAQGEPGRAFALARRVLGGWSDGGGACSARRPCARWRWPSRPEGVWARPTRCSSEACAPPPRCRRTTSGRSPNSTAPPWRLRPARRAVAGFATP